ncbi:MAG: hypothetical protein [Inoviridae sp.]|nr:MAG: hypothetical protein [Inoviridae sp.]
MYKGKVCGSFAVLLGLLATGSSIVFSSSAHAASKYDGVYQTVTDLKVKTSDCAEQTVVNYVQYMTQAQHHSFRNALATGAWNISQNKDSTGYQSVYIAWSETDKGRLIWGETYVAWEGEGINSIRLTTKNDMTGSGDCSIVATPMQTNSRSAMLSTKDGRYKNYQYTGKVTYPDGYAGGSIRDTVNDNKLRFGWSVDADGNVSAVDNQNVRADVLDHCGVSWTLYNSTSDYQKGSVVDTKTQPQAKSFEYSKIVQGYYILEEKPNYCVPFNNDGKIQPAVQNIEFKGLFIGGMSGTNKESSTIFGENNPLSQFGLTQAINAPLTAIQKLATTSCTPITIPLFNGTSTTAGCTSGYYKAKLPAVYEFWQIALTGMVAYAVAIGIIRHTKSLLNPEDDRIEVVQL